jgi:hypothetical protein
LALFYYLFFQWPRRGRYLFLYQSGANVGKGWYYTQDEFSTCSPFFSDGEKYKMDVRGPFTTETEALAHQLAFHKACADESRIAAAWCRERIRRLRKEAKKRKVKK